ncbi:MAG: DNA-processing protein DprA [Clostridia bacterium]
MCEIDEWERLHLWLGYGTEHFVRCFTRTLSRFPDLNEAFALAKQHNKAAFSFLPERCARRLMEAASDGFMERYLEKLIRSEIHFVMPFHETYPVLLKQIHDYPHVLYYKGKLRHDPALPIAVIGSRAATDYGRDIAKLFSYAFVQAGATVISGMASGVDSMAARGAMDCAAAADPTVAVLGTGVDIVYPPENGRLYAEIVERGAVVSEFLPGTEPKREYFPIRNRIMSGLSRGVLVVEAGERSGTSITVGYAHDEGREVFAIPGRITDVKSVGTNRLIQRGEAKPVFCVVDVLSEFQCESVTNFDQTCVANDVVAGLSDEERSIVNVLQAGEKSFDELSEMLSYPPGLLNSYLTALQFSGIMKQLPGRIYALGITYTKKF